MTIHQTIDRSAPSSPFGRGWIPASRDIGLPGEHENSPADPGLIFHDVPLFAPRPAALPHSAFTPERRIRFLDALAGNGNVRGACEATGISPQAAYKARRRDARFAAGWDAALLLAREHAEAVLADRALNGVEEIIFYRGEAVGRRRKFDNRLLLALLGRLDRRCGDSRAELAAERFDELLAAIGGTEADAELAEAADGDCAEIGLPASRIDYRSWALGRAMDEAEEAGVDRDRGYEMEEAAWIQADAVFDAWEARAVAAVDTVLEDEEEEDGGREREGGDGLPAQDSVNCVNPMPGSSLRAAAPRSSPEWNASDSGLPRDLTVARNDEADDEPDEEIDWSAYPNLRYNP